MVNEAWYWRWMQLQRERESKKKQSDEGGLRRSIFARWKAILKVQMRQPATSSSVSSYHQVTSYC